jgi:hypothetical protein
MDRRTKMVAKRHGGSPGGFMATAISGTMNLF